MTSKIMAKNSEAAHEKYCTNFTHIWNAYSCREDTNIVLSYCGMIVTSVTSRMT